MDKEAQRKSLRTLSIQQGHCGLIDVEDVLTIMELRDEKIRDLGKELGYRKLPKDKPPLLNNKELLKIFNAEISNPVDWMHEWLIDFSTELKMVAQAQREADIKFYS